MVLVEVSVGFLRNISRIISVIMGKWRLFLVRNVKGNIEVKLFSFFILLVLRF